MVEFNGSKPSTCLQSPSIPTIIYILKDPESGAVRYVGKTCKTLKIRLWQHTGRATNRKSRTYCAKWIRSLLERGLKPGIEQIEIAFGDWAAREAYWIAYYWAVGARLTNVTLGGEGAPGFKMSKEQRAKVKKARASPEWRAATGDRLRSLWGNPEMRAQIIAKVKATRLAPEYRAAARQKIKDYWAVPERRGAQSQAIQASWTDERRIAQTDRNRSRWNDPEWRVKTLARMREVAQTPEARAAQSARAQKVNENVQVAEAASVRMRAYHQSHPEARAKMAVLLKGRVFSPETLEKMRKAAKARWARERLAKVANGGDQN